MDKTLQLTLKINADTSGLNKALAGVGAGVKRVKVPVEFDVKDPQINIKPVKVGAYFVGVGEDLGATAAQRFLFGVKDTKIGINTKQLQDAGEKLSEVLAESIETAAKRSRGGGVLGAIGNVISAPFRAAQFAASSALEGAVFGVGQEVTRKLGKGVSAAIEGLSVNTIGSSELLGQKASEALFQGVKNGSIKKLPSVLGSLLGQIDKNLGSAAESIVGLAIKKGAAAVKPVAAKVRQAVDNVVPEEDALREGGVRRARVSRREKEDTKVAQEQLFAERQELLRNIQERREAIPRQIAQIEAVLSEYEDDIADEKKKLIERTQKLQKVDTSKLNAGDANALADGIVLLKNQLLDLQEPIILAKEQQARLEKELLELAKAQKESLNKVNLLGNAEERRSALLAKGEELTAQLKGVEASLKGQSKLAQQTTELRQKLAKAAETASEADLPEIVQQLDESKAFAEVLAKSTKALEKKKTEITQKLNTVSQQYSALPLQPKIVQEIAEQVSGGKVDPERVPQVVRASDATLEKGTKADYVPAANIVRLRDDIFEAVQKGLKLTAEQSRTLKEEVIHSFQFDFGSIEGVQAAKERKPVNQVSEPTADEIQRLAPELQGYVRAGADTKTQQVELEAKVAADRLAEKNQRIEKQAQDLADLEAKFGYAGATVQAVLQKSVGGDRTRIESLKPLAQGLGEEAVERIKALEALLNQLESYTRQSLQQVAEAKTGKAPQIDISKQKAILEEKVKEIFQFSQLIDSAELQFKDLAAAQKPVTQEPEKKEQAGALAVAKEKISDLGGIVQRVSGVLSPIGSVAEGTVHALAVVGKAGLALADRFGFVAASLIPGGALAYGPAKAVVKNVVGPLAIAGAASQVPGVGEVLGVLQSAIGALIAPETVGLANGISQAVTAELHSALPTLFSTLSRGLAESGLPGAGLSAQAVNSIGGLLINTLEPVVAGVTSAADATITAVGGAAQDLLSQLAAALVAGKVVQEGAKLATNEDARAGFLNGVETIGSGLGQVRDGVQDGIQDTQDAIDRTRRAVQKNFEGIKDAAARFAEGDISAVGDAVEETQAAVGNLTRGAQDVAKASTQGVQNVVEGAGKVVGVFGDLSSIKLPDGLNLVDLAKDQLIQVQKKLRQKLEETLQAEAQGLPVIGGSAFVKKDLALVGQLLEAKYEVVIDHVGDQVQQQIEAAPLDLPIKIAPLPELEPLVVQPKVQAQAQAIGQTVSTTARQVDQGDDPSPIELAQQQLKAAATPQPVSFNELLAEVDAAIAETDGEIKRVYAYFSEVVTATKKAIKKGDVEAISRNTSEAKRVAGELAAQISELQSEIAQSIPLLQENGIDVGPSTAVGERLRQTKSALGQKAALIPEKLAGIGVKAQDAPTFDDNSLAALDLSFTQVEGVLQEGATSLSKALKGLVEAVFEVQGDTLKQSLALAATSPRAQDLAVNAVGLVASSSVADHGQVAQLAADLTGALVVRQAIGAAHGAATGNLPEHLQTPDVQHALGKDLFGDITGFLTGNAANMVTGIPGSGAVAAGVVVPQLQKLRERLAALSTEQPDFGDEDSLAALNLDRLPEHAPGGMTKETRAKIREINQILADAEKSSQGVDTALNWFGEHTDRYTNEILDGARGLREAQAEFNQAEDQFRKSADRADGLIKELDPTAQQDSSLEKAQQEAERILVRNEGNIAAPTPRDVRQLLEKTDRDSRAAQEFLNKYEEQVQGLEEKAGVYTRPAENAVQGAEFDERLANPPKQYPSQTEINKKQLEAEQQQQISEIDKLIAQEQERLAEVRRMATAEQRVAIGQIDQAIALNLQQLAEAKAKAQAALEKTKAPNELLSTAAAERRSPQEEALARIAQAAQQGKPNPALDKIAQAAAQAKSDGGALDAIALAVEQGRQEREQVNQRLAAVAAGVGQLPSNTGDSFTPLIAPQRPFSAEEKLEQQRAEGRRRQASAQQAQQQATTTIQALDPQQALSGIEAIALSAKAQKQAIDTVDGQLQKAAAEGKAKAENLTRRLEALGQESQTELPSNTRALPDLPPPPPADPVFARLAQASQEGAQQQNAVADRLAAAAQEGKQAAQQQETAFAQLIGANTEIVRLAEETAKQAEQVSNEAFKGLLAVQDAKAAEERVNANLKELNAQRDPIYDAPAPSLESDRLAELRKQREQTSRPIQDFQAEDLSQYAVPRQTFNPTPEERGLVAQKRIERDASERQINDTLRTGKAPTASPDEIQIMADSAIASFEKNSAKFDAVAEQIELGSTRAQKALRSVGEGVTTFRQKLDDAGGISGVLGKVGESLSHVAEKAGLPVGVIGRLGNIIKGVGIAALAYVGVTQLGDAIVSAGRAAFESAINLERLQTRLRFVAGSDSAAGEDLEFLRKKSEELKLPLQGLIEQYTQFKISSKGTSVEGGETKEAFEGLIRAGRVLGLTQENIGNVTAQVGQAFRKQNADTEDLKTIAEGGIPIFEALSRVMGKSTAEVQKSIEEGGVTAEILAKALKLVGDEAKSGLPAALETAAASIDDLKKTAEDLGEKVGPFLLAGFSIGVEGVIAGIKLLQEGGEKLAPVFDAIGNGVGLLLDIASPIVGVIGAIALAIGGDLLDGIAIPFQAINAGLIEIREGFGAVAGVAVQALSAIGEQAAALGVNIPFLGEIIKYANPATIAVRLLGAAIGAFLVGQMIRMGVAIGGVVIPALASMAGTMTATVIPAIGAAITASLAFIATPLGATIAAIGIIAAVAAPHMDELANSISGVGDAHVKANDRATKFNNDYQKSLAQLSKGIPLTAEELFNLKKGFVDNIKEGKDTAETAAKLIANLDRMQASAEAAAQIQAKLTKAMADATKAIKHQSQAIDAGYSTRLAGLNESLANQQITRERFDQEELAAQGEKSGKYLALYQTQGDNLRSALAEANARLAAPLPDATRTEVKKQVETLQDQIYEIEQKGGEQRIALAQNRVKVTEGIEKDRAKRAENEIKTLENQLAAGTTAQVEIEHKISQTKQQETERRIKEIDRQLKTEVSAGGKVSEIAQNLYSERKVLESELSRITSEEATKRYDILLKDVEKYRDRLTNTIAEAEAEANIELQNAQNAGLLKQAEVESKRTHLTRDRLQKDLALELANIDELRSLPSPTDPEKAEEHQKRIRESKLKTAQITQQLAENEYKRQESIRKLATDALDQQAKGAQNAATQIEGISQAIQAASQLATNSLERQNKLLEAQKGLHASITSLVDEEYKILIDQTTDEERKAQLQQNAANYRLKSLKEAQALEREVLAIQQEQEKTQSRIAIIKAQANTLKAQAEVAKAQAEEKKVLLNPESTDADKQAARLGVESAQVGVFASQVELQGLLEAEGQREQLGGLKRRALGADQQKAELSAKFEYGKTITDPDRKEAYLNRIYSTARQGIQDASVLPIGNKRPAPPPDYTQVDSASQQLGLTPRGVNLGRFIPPTPVDLHSGLNVQGLQIGNLGSELKELRMLTQNGVAANLVTLVQQNQALTGQLMGLANRPQVVQNIHNKTTKRQPETAFAGQPL